jgi:hypothetical protein
VTASVLGLHRTETPPTKRAASHHSTGDRPIAHFSHSTGPTRQDSKLPIPTGPTPTLIRSPSTDRRHRSGAPQSPPPVPRSDPALPTRPTSAQRLKALNPAAAAALRRCSLRAWPLGAASEGAEPPLRATTTGYCGSNRRTGGGD